MVSVSVVTYICLFGKFHCKVDYSYVTGIPLSQQLQHFTAPRVIIIIKSIDKH